MVKHDQKIVSNGQRIFWVCLTILWGWYSTGLGPCRDIVFFSIVLSNFNSQYRFSQEQALTASVSANSKTLPLSKKHSSIFLLLYMLPLVFPKFKFCSMQRIFLAYFEMAKFYEGDQNGISNIWIVFFSWLLTRLNLRRYCNGCFSLYTEEWSLMSPLVGIRLFKICLRTCHPFKLNKTLSVKVTCTG